MSARISNSPQLDSGSFELVRNSMLQSDDLPLAEVVEANQWQSVFDEHEIDFGSDEDAVYTPAITLWSLISQAFSKVRCAVARPRLVEWLLCGPLLVREFATQTPEPTAEHGRRSLGRQCEISAAKLQSVPSRSLTPNWPRATFSMKSSPMSNRLPPMVVSYLSTALP